MLALVKDDGGNLDVLAMGGGQGEVERDVEPEESVDRGSSGACVCSRVLITSKGVTE